MVAQATKIFPISILALLIGFLPARADDQTDIRTVITSQTRALSEGDASTAFSYATPNIQDRFVSPEFFMAMVKTGYSALIGPQKFEVTEIETSGDQAVARARVVTNESKVFFAIYPLIRQPDGSWKIDGCFMQPMEGEAL
jgi:ketosteroid isomerase-like protein